MVFFLYYTRLSIGVAVLMGQWGFPYGLGPQPVDPSLPQFLFEVKETAEQHFRISMESYSFTPSEVVVDAGKPVRFTLSNQSFLVPHNFLLDDPDGTRLVDVNVSSGDTKEVTLTVTKPGIYLFYCDKKLLFFPSHRKKGMEGHLVVR